jgi:hypothetical protein
MRTDIQPTSIRLTAAQQSDLDRIAAAWGGGVRPLSRSQAVAEMIRRTAATLTTQTPNRNRRNRQER